MNHSECEKPWCTELPSKTYSDDNGNRLSLCEEHYYELVTGRKSSVTIG